MMSVKQPEPVFFVASIYYAEKNTPEGCVIKEYPDGRKKLVSFMTGTEKVVKIKVWYFPSRAAINSKEK